MPAPFWAKPRFVFFAVLLYLAAHFAIRMAMGPSLSNDDSEQALFSQTYTWTYRYKAPPLFTWVLVTLGQIIPVGAFSIGLLRYAFLGILYGFVYLTARRLLSDPRLSALCVYSFAAINPFAEASHRNLTHSTALTAVTAVTWYIFVRLAETPHLGWYLTLGAAFGLGMLAKWNFAILVLALPLACLLTRDGRPLILTWKVIPAALVAAAIVLPTFIATLTMLPPPDERLGDVLDIEPGRGLEQVIRGTLNLLNAAFVYSLPFLPVVVVLFALPLWRGLRAGITHNAPTSTRPTAALVGMTMPIGLALLWAFVLVAGAMLFRVRYLYPVLLILPVWFFMVVERGRPSDRALNLFALALMALTVFVAAKRVARVVGVMDCGVCSQSSPYGAIALRLAEAGYEGSGTILANLEHGGNLRPLFPRARVIDPTYGSTRWPPPSGQGQCLIVWSEGGEPNAREAALRPFEAYLADTLNGDPDSPHGDGAITESMLKPADGVLRIEYRLYDGPTGDCR